MIPAAAAGIVILIIVLVVSVVAGIALTFSMLIRAATRVVLDELREQNVLRSPAAHRIPTEEID